MNVELFTINLLILINYFRMIEGDFNLDISLSMISLSLVACAVYEMIKILYIDLLEKQTEKILIKIKKD